jgi:hypothetical protein
LNIGFPFHGVSDGAADILAGRGDAGTGGPIRVADRAGDRRGEVMTETVQVEAMSPTELVAEIRAGLEAVVDPAALARACPYRAGASSDPGRPGSADG